VDKAENDYRAAQTLASDAEPFPDQVCFFCQQSAEKYLKALLQEVGQPVPRTHLLLTLRTLLLPHHAALGPLRRGLDFLTRFAVGPRYPSFTATKRQAAAALRWAGRVREVCRRILGLRPPRRRKSP
jgi:HEPN domain-containing protein